MYQTVVAAKSKHDQSRGDDSLRSDEQVLHSLLSLFNTHKGFDRQICCEILTGCFTAFSFSPFKEVKAEPIFSTLCKYIARVLNSSPRGQIPTQFGHLPALKHHKTWSLTRDLNQMC